MCKIMEEALEQEAKETRIECIKNLMQNLKWTAEQAMDALNIPKTEQTVYLKMI